MKYLKKYKTFESIHQDNTNIIELHPSFVADILDICVDLNDQYPQTDKDGELVSFYSKRFRRTLKTSYYDGKSFTEPFTEYPSIAINMPWYTYGYSFGEMSRYSPSIKCEELKEVALRIKDFLGDAYISFLISNGPSNTSQVLNNDTKLSSGIQGFQIVYDPNLIS